MIFAVEYLDRAGAALLREQHREAHIAYRKSLGDALRMAGPLLSDSGAPIGSLVLLEADDAAAASLMADADPYREAGVFASVRVIPYRIMYANLPTAGR